MVAGYAVGGGHILHMICDLTVSTHCPLATERPHIDICAQHLIPQRKHAWFVSDAWSVSDAWFVSDSDCCY